MKYWAEKTQSKILLIDGAYDRIVSISKESTGDICFKESIGDVCFCEECDEYFDITLSKEEAIHVLQEAIDWIKEDI